MAFPVGFSEAKMLADAYYKGFYSYCQDQGSVLRRRQGRDSATGALQRHPVTILICRALAALAPASVVDPVAVANVPTPSRTESPQSVLDETRKDRWICRIELSSIDPLGKARDNRRASVWRITSGAIGVLRPKPTEHPRPVQKIMNERVDGDHVCAGRHPSLALRIAREQQVRQHHVPELWADAGDMTERFKQRRLHPLFSSRNSHARIGCLQTGVDPSDEIAVANVADK
ncbi:hypothetical protein [Methylocystis sp. H62]|uniref:hypothetical protein n=1 Tax=Methylocystis sp. H62 TaxID=2785789 RepID=UPI001AEDA940|nr:hypothetical protein [Methylocystis sp. H62]